MRPLFCLLMVASTISLAVQSGCQCQCEPVSHQPPKLRNITLNLDIHGLVPLFRQVSARIESGFGDPEIEQLRQTAETMSVDQQRMLEFPIRYRGADTLLSIDVFMNEAQSPDLLITTHPDLAAEIRSLADQESP